VDRIIPGSFHAEVLLFINQHLKVSLIRKNKKIDPAGKGFFPLEHDSAITIRSYRINNILLVTIIVGEKAGSILQSWNINYDLMTWLLRISPYTKNQKQKTAARQVADKLFHSGKNRWFEGKSLVN
jgi:hypothetical protein